MYYIELVCAEINKQGSNIEATNVTTIELEPRGSFKKEKKC